jgi:hypothetical protein
MRDFKAIFIAIVFGYTPSFIAQLGFCEVIPGGLYTVYVRNKNNCGIFSFGNSQILYAQW